MRKKTRHENDDTYNENTTPDEFCSWWNPAGTEEPSGASIGGHPDAARVWARKDPGRWTRRVYGTTARRAWACECYREEFRRWKDAGCPEREPFVSLALPLPEQKLYHTMLKETVSKVEAPKEESLRGRMNLLQKQKVALLNDKQPPENAKRVEGRVVENEDDDGSIPF